MWLARVLGLERKEGVRLVPKGRCGELRYYAGNRYDVCAAALRAFFNASQRER